MTWSEEARAAAAKRMRDRWRDPEYRRRQSRARSAAMLASPERRASRSVAMKKLNARLRTDEAYRKKWERAIRKARRSPDYRAMQALVMAETMSRPEERRRARFHMIGLNHKPAVRRRQWRTRRRKSELTRAITPFPAGMTVQGGAEGPAAGSDATSAPPQSIAE